MNIAQQLAKTVEQTHSLAQILHAAVAVIAREMRCGGCSVFLLEIRGLVGAIDDVLACSDARALEAALAAHLRLEDGSVASA